MSTESSVSTPANPIPKTTKSNRKLLAIEPSTDTDGSNITLYKYEVERGDKTIIQTVKTRKTRKYVENKYNETQHKEQIVIELKNYFKNYHFKNNNQLEEFKLIIRANSELKLIVDHLFKVCGVKLTQMQVRTLIVNELMNSIKVKLEFI